MKMLAYLRYLVVRMKCFEVNGWLLTYKQKFICTIFAMQWCGQQAKKNHLIKQCRGREAFRKRQSWGEANLGPDPRSDSGVWACQKVLEGTQ